MTINIAPSEEHELLTNIIYDTFNASVDHGGMDPNEALNCLMTALAKVVASFADHEQLLNDIRDQIFCNSFETAVNFYNKNLFGAERK